ncbi:hypothetical protein N7457_004712 [Penicillium paradoxum]|uniref:uncharacterized protein n=1 Tax=Penicillium paradoxum TaxID=176176 RepID=UPI002546AF6F|nr:uncharacterized protein N7457_004712 [Penicillium paradoxum]KAJ5782938.1 hypothetical protein N7457_004712 [Penicillium paradoxum]
MLRSKSETERSEILKEPRILICNYIAGLSESFSCHVELYRRKWNYLYEPHANTSAVYGEAKDRARVRKEAKQLFTHIQYLDQSLLMLKQITGETEMKSGIMETVKDFNQLSRQLKSMKLSYDTFIEQQVSKISLQESRQSMTEARDLQRLSYLGFVFAPLSLASSFFSINIQPLGGLASVWSFVVTSLSILSLSILVLLSLNGRLYDMVREAIRSLRLSMPSRPARDQQLTLPQTETSPGSQRQHTDAGHAHLEQRGDTTGRATPPQPGTRVNPPPIQEPRRTIDQMPENRWRNRERSPGARSQRRREPSVSASYYPPDTSVRRGSRPPNTRQLRKEPDNTPSYRPPVINE